MSEWVCIMLAAAAAPLYTNTPHQKYVDIIPVQCYWFLTATHIIASKSFETNCYCKQALLLLQFLCILFFGTDVELSWDVCLFGFVFVKCTNASGTWLLCVRNLPSSGWYVLDSCELWSAMWCWPATNRHTHNKSLTRTHTLAHSKLFGWIKQ